ncbi:MAG: hypothetical protein ACRDPK_07400 [Carbonactinosporaceae bacterium]
MSGTRPRLPVLTAPPPRAPAPLTRDPSRFRDVTDRDRIRHLHQGLDIATAVDHAAG